MQYDIRLSHYDITQIEEDGEEYNQARFSPLYDTSGLISTNSDSVSAISDTLLSVTGVASRLWTLERHLACSLSSIAFADSGESCFDPGAFCFGNNSKHVKKIQSDSEDCR